MNDFANSQTLLSIGSHKRKIPAKTNQQTSLKNESQSNKDKASSRSNSSEKSE